MMMSESHWFLGHVVFVKVVCFSNEQSQYISAAQDTRIKPGLEAPIYEYFWCKNVTKRQFC